MKRLASIAVISALFLSCAGCAQLACFVADCLANPGVASDPGVKQEIRDQVIKPRTEDGNDF